MSRASSVVVFGLVTALAACEAADPATPLAPDPAAESTVAPSILANLGDPAGLHGASVTWDDAVVGFIHYDAGHHLVAVHGYIVQLCLGDPLTKEPRMIVETPSAISQRFVAVRADDEPVVVYRSDTGAFSCALVASPDVRVASGSVAHDQTFTAASFQSTWRGTVTAPDGSSNHLTETYQLTGDAHDPTNPAKWSLNASKILIH